jgi:hypothetical protein
MRLKLAHGGGRLWTPHNWETRVRIPEMTLEPRPGKKKKKDQNITFKYNKKSISVDVIVNIVVDDH